MSQSLTADDAIAGIPDGATVVAAHACGSPTSLLEALAQRPWRTPVTVLTGLLLDATAIVRALDAGAIRLRTWHPTAPLRHHLEVGSAAYVPLRASEIPRRLSIWRPDVALVRICPPDRDGWCSLGPTASFARAAITESTTVIAEVDPSVPRTFGDTAIHVADIDVLVESSSPMPTYEPPRQTDVTRAISDHVVSLLPDRPVLQLGIGNVPEAVIGALAERRIGELRFVGMASDGMVDLFERGLIDEHAADDPPVRTPDMLGTATLMRFAHENRAIGVYDSTTAHAPEVLARNDRLVSVNSAIEVDATGQVNAEHLRGAYVSGVGGSVDFVEAASRSAGGLRIIALPSTTPDGSVSRIVRSFGGDLAVSVPRTMVDVIVTEHGVARLAGLSVQERAEALAAIAAPQHRHDVVGGRDAVAS